MLLLWIVGYISLAGYPGAIPGVSTFVLSRCTVVLFAVLSHPDSQDGSQRRARGDGSCGSLLVVVGGLHVERHISVKQRLNVFFDIFNTRHTFFVQCLAEEVDFCSFTVT